MGRAGRFITRGDGGSKEKDPGGRHCVKRERWQVPAGDTMGLIRAAGGSFAPGGWTGSVDALQAERNAEDAVGQLGNVGGIWGPDYCSARWGRKLNLLDGGRTGGLQREGSPSDRKWVFCQRRRPGKYVEIKGGEKGKTRTGSAGKKCKPRQGPGSPKERGQVPEVEVTNRGGVHRILEKGV